MVGVESSAEEGNFFLIKGAGTPELCVILLAVRSDKQPWVTTSVFC